MGKTLKKLQRITLYKLYPYIHFHIQHQSQFKLALEMI